MMTNMNPQVAERTEKRQMDAEVGRRVHMLMWDQGLTQTAFGARVGIDQSSVAKKLRGQRGWSIDELVITARALNTTVAYLVGEIDDPLCTPRDLNPEPTDSGMPGVLASIVHIDQARSMRQRVAA